MDEEVKVNPLANQGAGDAIPYPDNSDPIPLNNLPAIPSASQPEGPQSPPLVATNTTNNQPPITGPVFLHQCGQCPTLPSFQSDCLKVSTWLRATHTDFCILNHKLNLDGRFPTVDIGDMEIGNSSHILTDLSGQLKRDLDANLSDEQKMLAFSLGSLIESTLARDHHEWCRTKRADLIRAYRIDLRKSLKKILPNAILKVFYLNTSSKKNSNSRMSVPESIVVLEMLSKLLSSKNYFFAQDMVSSLDVVSFAVLAPVLAIDENVRNEVRDAVRLKFANLAALVDRMKEQFYPDWDELCEIYEGPEKEVGKVNQNNKMSGAQQTEIEGLERKPLQTTI